jgi:hypothetical protein
MLFILTVKRRSKGHWNTIWRDGSAIVYCRHDPIIRDCDGNRISLRISTWVVDDVSVKSAYSYSDVVNPLRIQFGIFSDGLVIFGQRGPHACLVSLMRTNVETG